MAIFECLIFLWVLDFVWFKMKYTKPNGPPVWYIFPFVGIAPVFLLPKRWYVAIWKWYLRDCPDVIMFRFLATPIVIVKNAAVRDAQNSDNCTSRAGSGFEKTFGLALTGKPYYTVMDDNQCEWRNHRKMNLFALNILPRERRFDKTAEVADRFLKTIEEQEGRLWSFREDFKFAKLQEAANVNLGGTFNGNNIRPFITYLQKLLPMLVFLFSFGGFPPKLFMWIEPLLPKTARMSVLKRVHATVTSALLEKKMKEIDEPSDFVGAVLKMKKPEAALEFIREMGFFNMIALTHTTQLSTMVVLANAALDRRIHQKLQEEVDRVVGTSPLMYEHLAHLHYLKAVIQEAYRVGPAVPSVMRLTTGPAQVGGCTIESDLRVVLLIASEARDVKTFPNPDDFIPERYINVNGDFETVKEYSAFGRGKRRCPGTDLAMMSSMVYCAKILQHFEMYPERPDEVLPKYAGTAMTEMPTIPLRFVRREGAPKIEPVTFDCNLTDFLKEVAVKALAEA